jgi:hypothetical protein
MYIKLMDQRKAKYLGISNDCNLNHVCGSITKAGLSRGRYRTDGRTDGRSDDGCWVVRDLDAL